MRLIKDDSGAEKIISKEKIINKRISTFDSKIYPFLRLTRYDLKIESKIEVY